MSSPRSRASAAAKNRRFRFAGERVVYADAVEGDPDRTVREIMAVPSQVKRHSEVEGRGVVRSIVQAFVLRAGDLQIAGLSLPPSEGHSIYWNGGRWDAFKPDGERSVWTYHDDAHRYLRAWFQQVGDPFEITSPPEISGETWFGQFVDLCFSEGVGL